MKTPISKRIATYSGMNRPCIVCARKTVNESSAYCAAHLGKRRNSFLSERSAVIAERQQLGFTR